MKFTKLTDDKRDITFEVKGELPMTDKSNIIYMNTPSFTGRNVPITEIANVIGMVNRQKPSDMHLEKEYFTLALLYNLINPMVIVTIALINEYGKKLDILVITILSVVIKTLRKI